MDSFSVARTECGIKSCHECFFLLAVLYGNSHFTVAVFCLEEKLIQVHDGLGYPLDMWEGHLQYALLKYSLISSNQKTPATFAKDKRSGSLFGWDVLSQGNVCQTNGYSCGPLACI